MKNNHQLKKEISDFIKNKIYKNYDYRNGFSLQKSKQKIELVKAIIIIGRNTKNNIPMIGWKKL